MENVNNSMNFGSTVHAIKANHTEGPLGKAISAAAHEKNAVRKAEATSEDVTINVGNEPGKLIFNASIEGINAVLGENAVTATYDAESNSGSEAIAQNIVDFTTAAYPQFVENNPDLSAEDSVQSFFNAISEGMNNAVTDAKTVLTGLEALDDETTSMLDLVNESVMQGVQSYLDTAIAA